MKKSAIVILFCIVSFNLFAGNIKADKDREAKVQALANVSQLEFIENKGQFLTTEGKPADNVLFKANFGNCDIYITDKGLSYVFVKFEEKETGKSEKEKGKENELQFSKREEIENKIVSYYRLDMDLVGATIDKANIISEDESKQGYSNYFFSHCPQGIYDVKAYRKITIRNIYKGIDWVIYTNSDSKEQPLKYDFVVHPQADYKDIKIKYVNADSLSLTNNNSKLKIQCIAGNIEEGNLYSFIKENDDEIQSNYILENDSIISFKIYNYDSSKTLIIDPLVWATYYFSGNSSNFNSITTDSQNNVYITGSTVLSNFPTQQLSGAFWQSNIAGQRNTFILKFSSQNVRVWATYYGGSGGSGGNAICTDSQDNIYICGYAHSNFPTQQLSGAYWQPNIAGYSDVFILKFNSLGIRQWATYYGGNSVDEAFAICADSQDNIYICGKAGLNFPVQQLTGAYWQPNGAGSDAFVLKFNSNGVRIWATYYGGNLGSNANSICADSQDNIYLTGETASTNFPVQQLTGAYWQSMNIAIGIWTVFILKFNNQGVRLWATYYGGSTSEIGNSICTDSQDNIYITGYTFSYDFPTQQLAGAYWQPTNNVPVGNGGTSAYILKFNSQGVRTWATYYGGACSHTQEFYSIKADMDDNIFVTGYTGCYNMPVQQAAGEYWQANMTGGWDAFILKFNSQGVRQWATFYGGTNSFTSVQAFCIAVDKQNAVYIIGRTIKSDTYTLNPGNGVFFYGGINGQYDNFILKIAPCNVHPPLILQSNKNNFCVNDTGMITLSSHGGSGDTLKWYRGVCGQNFIGKDTVLTIPSPTQTTTYYARWESICDTSTCDSITINVLPIAVTDLNLVICEGDSITVGLHIYNTAGMYTDTLIAVNGCDSIINTTLTVHPQKYTTLNPVICQGEMFWVGSHNYNISGNYMDTLSNYQGCDSIITTHLLVVPIPIVSLGNDTILCLRQSLILDATNQYSSYLWQDNSTNPVFTADQQGIYWVSVSVNSNCIVSDTINISVEDCQNPGIFIPNSFTPNGDGLNDVFYIKTIAQFSKFNLFIYNRWGQLIFETDNADIGWDGTFNGKPVQMDVYNYKIEAFDKESKGKKVYSGRVTVVK